MYHAFHWVLVATKFLTAKSHAIYVKKLELEILERSKVESESDIFTSDSATLVMGVSLVSRLSFLTGGPGSDDTVTFQ